MWGFSLLILFRFAKLVRQSLGEFKENLELDFKLFFFVNSGSALSPAALCWLLSCQPRVTVT